ncbi:MAG TPA: amylo-alpha-1,6-glucosidase [Blastocatellia bacterium]|nr:amylo-alpha-1,6-glucosidase [Blastocatellia bacterium]HMX26163.1 amylo-alpha-1,6-glucosidase [Blastocatellia bacterium]HMZ18548.1 amylo-alpha-1,6-glucosidase [Blastocatellia bacterium]HNG33818.1 amylo-alpha-1,6-glucosidase [Blastocatellia bacterium]
MKGNNITRRLTWPGKKDNEEFLTQEWLVTNGLGGYASGTLAGAPTRRFHGLLIASLPAPFGRTMMLNHLIEDVTLADGSTFQLGGEEQTDGLNLPGVQFLAEFQLEAGMPVWRFEIGGAVLEKRVFMPRLQNTTYVSYRLLSGEPARLRLRPYLYFRPHEGLVSEALPEEPYVLTIVGERCEITARKAGQLGWHGDGAKIAPPSLKLWLDGEKPALTLDRGLLKDIFYRVEARRGYDSHGLLWSPGYFSARLSPNNDTTLIASTEEWATIQALAPVDALKAERLRRARLLLAAAPAAREGLGAELTLAADQFVITPAGRLEEATRARAAGDEVRTVIAGYHWFTDWGRDTMISLEGLTLSTGRFAEAGWILRTFAHYVRDGLIPNMFPEGEREGLYHTADATLWFFHALDRYVQTTGDRETLREVLPVLQSIVSFHLKGTRFGIGVDARDGLLKQGEQGYQLTWMDAKVDDWVVTPRRGKAVEINALWYNALRLLESWLNEEGDTQAAQQISDRAEHARRSFNERFWFAEGNYLYDVVDGETGDDAACRPNQILSFSLAHPVLNHERRPLVLEVVREQLLTPVGLRSLAPGHTDYKPRYDGDLRSRDAAYHQGTVWGWLIGPFIDAWLRVHPEDAQASRTLLKGFAPHLDEACVGSISEIFDAETPYTPRGCAAQAWSVAEVLRCWVKTG